MLRLCAAVLAVGCLCYGQEFRLGSKISDFQIEDLNGSPVQFSAVRGPVTVVVFISTQCPVSNAYNDRMNSVYKDYSAKGVKFVFINANKTEPADEVARHAQSVGFTFPVYKDADNRVADRFNAQVTPEAYLIDATGTIVYHGQIDDNRNEQRVEQKALRMALDAVLQGQPVPVAKTKAFGCTIKRVRHAT